MLLRELNGKHSPGMAMSLSATARRVLEKRYLKEADGRLETPGDMFRRVAFTLASVELDYDPSADVGPLAESFYGLMSSLDFLPNSPTLLNAGSGEGQLAACFVLPVADSIESIGDILKQIALIHKSGGSTSFNLSPIRPYGDGVGERSGVAGGPVGLMDVLSVTSDYIRQGGIRRGCNTVILSVDHPDILEFIRAKADPLKLTNFYTSVAVPDSFMEMVKNGEDYPLINPKDGQVTATVNAREVFFRIVDQAWRTGDPGLVFVDRINECNPTPQLGRIEHISGCGENTLLPYESCILGSINLVNMLREDDGSCTLDWEHLERTINLSVRLLDNAIDANCYPIKESQVMAEKTRKIGLGVMGFADMLIMMGIPYDSYQAIDLAERMMGFISDHAHRISHHLALEKGPFPAYQGSIYRSNGGLRRNASVTAIAPTGTLSLIAGVSSGIEPIFATVYVRNILDGEKLLEVNPRFEEAAKKRGFLEPKIFEELVVSNHLQRRKDIPEDVKRLFVTAHRVSPEWHVKIQSAFQRYTDNAVSKTVNFPHRATRDDIARVFTMAYESGLKGITVYRDGSRKEQPLSTSEDGIRLVRDMFSPARPEAI